MCLALDNAVYRRFCIISCRDASARIFDCFDGGGGGARDGDVDGLCEGYRCAVAGEELDAVFDAMEAAGGEEFADCERGGGRGGGEARGREEVLEGVEVEGG
jgi:hypothetical protein